MGWSRDGPGVSEEAGSNLPVGDRQASETELPAGIVTFVMTDIEGSTRLFREVGERYVDVLATHQALLRGPFTHHGGVEVGVEGDALFFAFADASEAVAACLEGQRALAAHPWPAGVELRVRIGMHTGEARPVRDELRQSCRASGSPHQRRSPRGPGLALGGHGGCGRGPLACWVHPDRPRIVSAAWVSRARAPVPARSPGPSPTDSRRCA